MMRKLVFVTAWIIASGVASQAAPTPTPAPATNRASAESDQSAGEQKVRSKRGKKARNKPALKVAPATALPLGWSIVNGEWVHSDGYKYVNGQVVRTGSQTHKTPPKPPSKAQLKAVAERNKPAPTPPPNTAAAKAAEVQRNKMPSRPASQTGSHL
jgi:hypothetical protein